MSCDHMSFDACHMIVSHMGIFIITSVVEPSATIEPPTHTVTIGDRTHFTCRVQQGTSPITILWRYENHNKLPSGVNNTHDDVLSFDNVQTKHNGTYSCIVSNSWGSVEISATLLVQGELIVLCIYVSI